MRLLIRPALLCAMALPMAGCVTYREQPRTPPPPVVVNPPADSGPVVVTPPQR